MKIDALWRLALRMARQHRAGGAGWRRGSVKSDAPAARIKQRGARAQQRNNVMPAASLAASPRQKNPSLTS
jgi:hypothetical protein